MSAAKLTKRQERAMLAFLWGGPRGFDDEACDGAVWDWGVRPWPTMDNLVTKGLIERDSWNGLEEGWLYRLTDAGRSYMADVVAARKAGGRQVVTVPRDPASPLGSEPEGYTGASE